MKKHPFCNNSASPHTVFDMFVVGGHSENVVAFAKRSFSLLAEWRVCDHDIVMQVLGSPYRGESECAHVSWLRKCIRDAAGCACYP